MVKNFLFIIVSLVLGDYFYPSYQLIIVTNHKTIKETQVPLSFLTIIRQTCNHNASRLPEDLLISHVLTYFFKSITRYSTVQISKAIKIDNNLFLPLS